MSSGWGRFFLVFGALLVVFSLGRLFRNRKRNRSGGYAGGGEDPEADGTERGGWYAERERLIRELDRHLETRIHALRALMEEADERIRELARLEALARKRLEEEPGAGDGPGEDGEGREG